MNDTQLDIKLNTAKILNNMKDTSANFFLEAHNGLKVDDSIKELYEKLNKFYDNINQYFNNTIIKLYYENFKNNDLIREILLEGKIDDCDKYKEPFINSTNPTAGKSVIIEKYNEYFKTIANDLLKKVEDVVKNGRYADVLELSNMSRENSYEIMNKCSKILNADLSKFTSYEEIFDLIAAYFLKFDLNRHIISYMMKYAIDNFKGDFELINTLIDSYAKLALPCFESNKSTYIHSIRYLKNILERNKFIESRQDGKISIADEKLLDYYEKNVYISNNKTLYDTYIEYVKKILRYNNDNDFSISIVSKNVYKDNDNKAIKDIIYKINKQNTLFLNTNNTDYNLRFVLEYYIQYHLDSINVNRYKHYSNEEYDNAIETFSFLRYGILNNIKVNDVFIDKVYNKYNIFTSHKHKEDEIIKMINDEYLGPIYTKTIQCYYELKVLVRYLLDELPKDLPKDAPKLKLNTITIALKDILRMYYIANYYGNVSIACYVNTVLEISILNMINYLNKKYSEDILANASAGYKNSDLIMAIFKKLKNNKDIIKILNNFDNYNILVLKKFNDDELFIDDMLTYRVLEYGVLDIEHKDFNIEVEMFEKYVELFLIGYEVERTFYAKLENYLKEHDYMSFPMIINSATYDKNGYIINYGCLVNYTYQNGSLHAHVIDSKLDCNIVYNGCLPNYISYDTNIKFDDDRMINSIKYMLGGSMNKEQKNKMINIILFILAIILIIAIIVIAIMLSQKNKSDKIDKFVAYKSF